MKTELSIFEISEALLILCYLKIKMLYMRSVFTCHKAQIIKLGCSTYVNKVYLSDTLIKSWYCITMYKVCIYDTSQ